MNNYKETIRNALSGLKNRLKRKDTTHFHVWRIVARDQNGEIVHVLPTWYMTKKQAQHELKIHLGIHPRDGYIYKVEKMEDD